MVQVFALVSGGLVGLGAGNLSLRLLFSPPRRDVNNAINPNADIDRSYNTPPPVAFRRSVLAVAIASSVALAAGGPPAALAEVSRPLVAGALAAALLVAVCGALWGCTRGGETAADTARGAYGKVASDDREAHEVELKPFVGGGAGGDETDDDGGGGGGRGDDDYLDEEDGYLADEGETERSGSGRRGGAGAGGGRRVNFSTLPPAKSSVSPPRRGGGGASKAPGGSRSAAAAGAAEGKETRPKAAPPAKSLFSVGHTVEL